MVLFCYLAYNLERERPGAAAAVRCQRSRVWQKRLRRRARAFQAIKRCTGRGVVVEAGRVYSPKRKHAALLLCLSLALLTETLPSFAQPATPTPGQPAGDWLDQPDPTRATPQLQTPTTPAAPLAGGQTPVEAPQTQALPLPTPEIEVTGAKFGKLELLLNNAVFLESTVQSLHLTATDLDLKEGLLGGLLLEVQSGSFKDVAFDQLRLEAKGNMRFDSNVLLNGKTLEFKSPTEAEVYAVISQESLNKIVNSPTFLGRLSFTANRKVGMLASMLGAHSSNLGLKLSEASVALRKGNHVSLGVQANLGVAGVGMPLPLQIDTKIGLADGWFSLSDTHLITNGQEISPLLSEFIVKKLNDTANWGWKSPDLRFSFSQLRLVPNKQLILKGTALINRLRFGKQPSS